MILTILHFIEHNWDVIIGVFILIFIIFYIIYRFPKWQTKRIIDFKSKRWEAENEFRRTLIQVLGGLVVILSLLFTWAEMRQSQRNFEKGQHITRFSQAIKFLGESNSDQKIGGIFTLEQIAKESPEEYLGTVIEVLSAFVRNVGVDDIDVDTKKPEEKKGTKGDKEKPKDKKEGNEKKEEVIKEKYKIKPETQIAMTVLGRIRTIDNKKHWEKLPRINLLKVKLRGANLIGANLMDADLIGAELMGAELRRANLIGANLTDASLIGAELMGAELMGAYLVNTNLIGAKLKGAGLRGAKLRYADLMDANLMGVDLTDAKNLKVEQLLKVTTLYGVKGLPLEMEKELKEKKPQLFEKPKIR